MEIMVIGGRDEIGGNAVACYEGSNCIILDSGYKIGHARSVPYFHLIRRWGISYEDISDVIVSHAHFDHYGGLPYLFDKGYGGRVLSSMNSKKLLEFLTVNPYLDSQLNNIERGYISGLFFQIKSKLKEFSSPTGFDLGGFVSNIQTANHMEGSIITHIEGKASDILYLGDVGRGFTKSMSEFPENVDVLMFDATLFYFQPLYRFERVLEVFRMIIEISMELNYPVVFPVNPLGYQQKIIELVEPIVISNNYEKRIYHTPLSYSYQQLFDYSGHLDLKLLPKNLTRPSIIIGAIGERDLKKYMKQSVNIFPSKFRAETSSIDFNSISHLDESAIRKRVVPGSSFYLPISLHAPREEIMEFADLVCPRLAIPLFGRQETPQQISSARKMWARNSARGKLIFPKIGEIVE